MEAQTFLIRSVTVQNLIMAIICALVLLLLVRSLWKRNVTHVVAVLIWAMIALWFFNGPFWGFSAVTVSPDGLKVEYGFLSMFRNTTLPVDTAWTIRHYLGGIRRMKKLVYFQLAGHQSMKVGGGDKLETLRALGAAIDGVNGRPMGETVERPVNM